ncbi:hypothetical protein ACEPAI_1416 [Sanghuangporus weigelae]
MKVWCLLIDHEKKAAFGEAFSVIVGLDACIQDLKKKVKEERPVDLEHVDAARLTVWRCTDPSIDFADIDSDEFNDRLNEVFSPDEQKTLLIEVPEPQLATTIPSKRPFEESPHSYAEKMARKAPTPSAAAKPHGMRFQQVEFPIHNGVPYERTGHYVSIYSSALGALKDAIRNPSEEPLSADLLQKIHSFIYDSAKLYETEDARRKKMISHLGGILERHVHNKYRIEGAELDGIIFREFCGGIVPFLCVEVKDTVGIGADGAYQGACGWRKFIVQNKTTFRKTCSPSVIISIMGPYINISGAVFTREFIVESFTGYIFLGSGVSMDDRVIEVARIFRAISVALNELEAEYVSKTSNTALMMPRPGFRDADAPELQFVKRLFEDDEHNAKAMFLAKLQEKDVLVKFTHRYNDEAHRTLDSERRAPALHFVGDIVGGLKMVVMEYIDGETVQDLKGRNRLLPASASKDFKRALELLHQQGIVHGDYRMPNLLVKDGRGYVVDFDWCGKHSEARYPPTLNDFDNIAWADGVARGSLMMKEHDCHLFSKLLEEVGVEK